MNKAKVHEIQLDEGVVRELTGRSRNFLILEGKGFNPGGYIDIYETREVPAYPKPQIKKGVCDLQVRITGSRMRKKVEFVDRTSSTLSAEGKCVVGLERL